MNSHQQYALSRLLDNLKQDIASLVSSRNLDSRSSESEVLHETQAELNARVTLINKTLQDQINHILENYTVNKYDPYQTDDRSYMAYMRPGYRVALRKFTAMNDNLKPGEAPRNATNGRSILTTLAGSTGTVYEQWVYTPKNKYDQDIYKVMIRLDNGYVVAAYNDQIVEHMIENYVDITSISGANEYTDLVTGEKIPLDSLLSFSDIEHIILPTFINYYLHDRAYGGPEEGGWWYETYQYLPVLDDWTIPDIGDNRISEEDNIINKAEESRQFLCTSGQVNPLLVYIDTVGSEYEYQTIQMNRLNKNRPNIGHSNSQGVYEVRLEEFAGESSPKSKPHYE